MVSNSATLNLKLFIQGFYIGNGLMNASIDPIGYPMSCDTVTVVLSEVAFPRSPAYISKGVIDIFGNGVFTFPSAAVGTPYYLCIHHRNAVETWSSSPVLMNSITNYDFTTAASQAYGSNQVDLLDGRFAFYNGDISSSSGGLGFQDGVVEDRDYSEMENAVYFILSGYLVQDLTGDGVVEDNDYSVIENNTYHVISMERP
jgi:hypothetical protein